MRTLESLKLYSKKVGRIRGETVKERIQFIISRCENVEEACRLARQERRDLTNYRLEYSNKHKLIREQLSRMQFSGGTDLDIYIDNLKQEFLTTDVAAHVDTLGYLIVELSKANRSWWADE